MDFLKEESPSIESILRQSADPFFFLDADGRIQVWNRGAELLFGWNAAEAVGERVDILIPEQQSITAAADELRGQLHDAVVVQNYETAFRAKNGRTIPVKITITLIRDDAEKIVGSAVSVRDITREKSLEEEIVSRVNEMCLLEQVMHAAQGTLDLQRILRVILTAVTAGSGLGFNRAFLFLITDGNLEARLAIGSSSWDEAGRTWPCLAHNEDLSAVIDQVLAEPDPAPTEAQRLTQDWLIPLSERGNVLVRCVEERATLVWPSEGVSDGETAARLGTDAFAVAPLVHAGESIGIVLADNVVTKKPIDQDALRLLRLLAGSAASVIANARLYEKVLHHVRDLEIANRQILNQQQLIIRARHMASLGEIAATISHEVKQPLIPIGGFARRMRRSVDDNSRQAEMLDIIIDEVNRLERVLQGVIALASLPLPNLEPVSFSQIVSDVYDLYRNEANARHIALVTDIPAELPPPHLDDEQWHQLLVNLVSNAMNAIPADGKITIGIGVVENEWYRVTVSDTGIGVAHENIRKAFGPLFATKPTDGGMGLSVVAQIVQRHHGRVDVRSSMGEGTTISIEVPPPEALRAFLDEERRAAEGQEEAPDEPDSRPVTPASPETPLTS